MTEISLMTIRKSDPCFLLQFASRRKALRKEELTLYQIFICLYCIMIMNDADDACRQISYEARLGGIWIGQIGVKLGKRGDKKIFFWKSSFMV